MAIVTSSYTTDQHSQPGGGRWTIETHIDSEGNTHNIGPYLWDGITDRNVLLTSRAASLAESLAETEADLIIGA